MNNTVPQRMSDSDLADIDSFIGEWGIGRRLYQQLIAERAIVERAEALPVHEFHCYYPELENRQFVELKDIQATQVRGR